VISVSRGIGDVPVLKAKESVIDGDRGSQVTVGRGDAIWSKENEVKS